MFLETKTASGLVYIRVDTIVSICPADVRENKSDSSRLVSGSAITVDGGTEYFVLDSPMDIAESIAALSI